LSAPGTPLSALCIRSCPRPALPCPRYASALVRARNSLVRARLSAPGTPLSALCIRSCPRPCPRPCPPLLPCPPCIRAWFLACPRSLPCLLGSSLGSCPQKKTGLPPVCPRPILPCHSGQAHSSLVIPGILLPLCPGRVATLVCRCFRTSPLIRRTVRPTGILRLPCLGRGATPGL
jgi:hypothetical protein